MTSASGRDRTTADGGDRRRSADTPRRGPRSRRPGGGADAGGAGQPPGDGAARRFLAGLLLPLAAIGLAAVGLLIPVARGISGTAWVTAALIAAWALCGAATACAPERTPQWQLAAGALLAAVAFAPTGSAPGSPPRPRPRRTATSRSAPGWPPRP